MNELSPCGRFEKEGLLKLEAGEPLDAHFATCPDCLEARSKYKRLARLLSLATRTESPPVGWEARLLARIDSADHLSAAALGHDCVGGRYRLTRRIGEGALGVVWGGVDVLTSREVAVKMILAGSRDLSHRLLREAKAWGSLSHPNIMELLDLGKDETGYPFLVMPLLEGETLAELLRRQTRLNVPIAAQIARDVARALAAAHAAGVLHRDLKPRNIFLHHEPGTIGLMVKVLDFGFNKNVSPQKGMLMATGQSIFPHAYMSPEQFMGRTIDQRSDLWSLGVVLFEMLNGRLPFQDEVTIEPILPQIALTLDGLIARCLHVDRDHRMGSAEEIAELLNGFADPNNTDRSVALISLEGTKIKGFDRKDALQVSSSSPAPRVAATALSAPLLQTAGSTSEANDKRGRRSADQDALWDPPLKLRIAIILGWIVLLAILGMIVYVQLR